MNYWYMKSEPDTFSWQDQLSGSTSWDGVRNYQARNYMMQMKLGDQAFFYHSNKEKAIIGIVEVIKEYYPDSTDKTGRFVNVDVKPIKTLKKSISLSMLKEDDTFSELGLVKQSRLSVGPVSQEQWQKIMEMAKK